MSGNATNQAQALNTPKNLIKGNSILGSFQISEFQFCSDEDRNIRVGVFP
jgi:hypothetical protein